MNFSHLPIRGISRHIMPLLLVLFATFAFVACATAPKPEDIPADLSPAKFFQRVQESVDTDQYDTALFYLDEFRKRFGTSTGAAILDKMMEADYLTAQISYKQGKLADARAGYSAILQQYENVPNEAVSPPRWIKILCGKMIVIIDKKLADSILKPAPSPSPSPAVGTDTQAASPAPASPSAATSTPTATASPSPKASSKP